MPNPSGRPPEIVMQLSASVSGGTPIAWKEYDDKWVIVVADGRKYTFKKNDPELPRRLETVASYKEPRVDTSNLRPDGNPRLARKRDRVE
jgi:hypothetical protein